MPVSYSFTIASGTAADEQDLLQDLGNFLTNSLGTWNLVATPVDTPTDLRQVYSSTGSAPGLYPIFYIHLRATSDQLRYAAMTDYKVAGDIQYNSVGSVTDTSQNSYVDTGNSSIAYWFVGNEDFVHVVVSGTSEECHGGFGLWNSYFQISHDPIPFLVFGQNSETQTFSNTDRLRSYRIGAWVTPVDTTLSGSSGFYRAAHNSRLSNASPNVRSGAPKLFELPFYTNEVARLEEVRGEVPGLYYVGGAPYSLGHVTTITGTIGQVGDYFIYKLTDDNTWALGPIITII